MQQKVAFVGSGLIGAGLAVNSALHGKEVVLQTRRNVDRCNSLVTGAFDKFESKEVITHEQRVEAEARCRITTSIEDAVTGAFFIQESGPENLDLKHEIVAQIEAFCPEDAVIASSTSGLSVTKIFENAKHPERGVVGHPYNPAYILPLVEVVRGEKTSDEALKKAVDFYISIGKEPAVLNREFPGFIANRFQWAIHREVVELVSQGVCSVEAADKALVYSVGLRWGIIGQYMTMHLGAQPEGIGRFNEKYHIDGTKEARSLACLAKWTTFPQEWYKMAAAGIEEEMANRPAEQGNDVESIANWRDDMMIDMLRLHHKL